MLREVCIEESYVDDVTIDFSKLSQKEKSQLIKSLTTNGTFTFKKVPLFFSKDVEVDVELY